MLFVVAVLVLNFIFSIGVIFTNKFLYKYYNVPPISLASAHFAATFTGLTTFWLLGGFKIKHIKFIKVLPISIAFSSSVVFTNFSLKYNSVGTYQILKCLGDPMLIVLQTFMYNKTYPANIKMTLGIMVCGIVLNSMFDVTFNMVGIIFAMVAVVASTFYILWIEKKQEELEVTPLQLLMYQAPTSSMLLNSVVLFIEPPWEEHGILCGLHESVAVVFVSMVMACGVNITVFYIIRHTSVVTYAVFSKLKTCVVILGGAVILSQEAQEPVQILGIVLTLIGTIIYTIIKLRNIRTNHLDSQDASQKDPPSSKSNLKQISIEVIPKKHQSIANLISTEYEKSI
ncbi:solute carrier family 35 member E3-like isoform X1 [Styela clava]|uniref:solute carrier family 35 member E3-like isoform X1 n=1 Tax=Styela clava TaxID=7725 RepID=UPI001939C6C5|nr:solute carrier family 35 member E3-like isoform X1 [Styela clava]